MNRHPDHDSFRRLGEIAPGALEQHFVQALAGEILTLGIPLSDPLRIATGLAERGFISAIINPHLDAAIDCARALMRQAT